LKNSNVVVEVQQEAEMKHNSESATFGPYLKQLRMQKRITLREFSRLAKADPGNISRLERGVLRPPQDRDILERYANALGLKDGSDESYRFFDFAAADCGLVPSDIMKDEEVVKVLPILFRTLRNEKPTEEELDRLVEKLRRS
jgi:transcriptional regulator with XRE-family HTH domain